MTTTPDNKSRKATAASASPRESVAGPSAPQAEQRLGELARLHDPSIDDVAEAIIAWSQAAFGTAEIVAAQEQFFARMGKVFSDDPFYDARMSYFFDWFLLERVVSTSPEASSLSGGEPGTPMALVRRELQSRGIALGSGAAARLEALASYRHSLFEIGKIGETTMTVTDLVEPAKIPLGARPGATFRGLEKKMIFQGFVFKAGDVGQLSHGLVLHPARAAAILKKRLKTAKKAPEFDVKTELCRFASTQLRHLRHRHVDPKTIYLAGLK